MGNLAMKKPIRPLGRWIREFDEGVQSVLCPHCGSSMVWRFGWLGRYVLRHFGVQPVRCMQSECDRRRRS